MWIGKKSFLVKKTETGEILIWFDFLIMLPLLITDYIWLEKTEKSSFCRPGSHQKDDQRCTQKTNVQKTCQNREENTSGYSIFNQNSNFHYFFEILSFSMSKNVSLKSGYILVIFLMRSSQTLVRIFILCIYPSILCLCWFSCDWKAGLQDGKHGAALSQNPNIISHLPGLHVYTIPFKALCESTLFHRTHSPLSKSEDIMEPGPVQGWAGKAFLLPGTGREIENYIPVLREGNGNFQIATGREGKFEACNPGNPGKSRESYKKQD